MTNMLTRYVIGCRELIKLSGTQQKLTADSLIRVVNQARQKPIDEFRSAIVVGVLRDTWADEKLTDALVKREPELKGDLAILRLLENEGAKISQEHWEYFEQRHGWVARLARAQATGWTEPGWQTLRVEAIRTVTAIGAITFGGLVALILGAVLLIMTLVRWYRVGVPTLVQRLDSRRGSLLVEAFAIYLFAYTILLSTLHEALPGWPSAVFYGVALAFVILAIFWPRWRGMEKKVWQQALGFHRGAGVFREVRAGVIGWITGLPLLAASVWLAQLIAQWTGDSPTHPIVEELGQPGFARWGIVVLAVVWAPLVEETMFRGLLFPGLSSISRWFVGAVVSAFVFAVIHPQGWAGVPPIMVIALTMSTLRLTRGSLIAPMAAHALNNGLVSVLLLVAM
ncbi:MAG: CPBP family intramembrane metalloprotease [Verrucomicrobia bacterium]|nr:CPBP family intramembrane metalloprotease [Verrucomicrobiota bacterium]